MDEVWTIFSRYLFFIHYAFNVKIHCFVLMNNHFHMVLSTPNANLDSAMNYFMRETSRIISKETGRINQTYGGPYNWSILRSSIYFSHCYKYVYRNPIEAGLSTRVELYKYSTLRGLLGFEHTIIPIEDDELLFQCLEDHLLWLNTSYPSKEVMLDIKNAMGKKEFKFAYDKNSNYNPLEYTLV